MKGLREQTMPLIMETDTVQSRLLKGIARYVPIVDWLPRYDCRELLLKDVACGITLGCILIGQSLAHATLSKVGTMHGPYSCMLPPVVYAVFGTCHQASVGTGGLLALLTGTSVERFPELAERNHAAALLSLEVGLLMSAMGIFQLSFLVRFLSRPALSGFITGSAVLIIRAMLLPMLGLPAELAKDGLRGLAEHPERLLRCNVTTVGLSLVSFSFLFFAKSLLPRCLKDLKELIALSGSGAFCYFCAQGSGVALVGSVPSGLPGLVLPIHSLHHLALAKELLPEAALIALVCFISSFASAKKCAMKGGYQVSPLNELLALGFANLCGAFTGAVPTQIGLSRSALAYDMGVKTQLGANVFVAAVVVGVVQVFSPALQFVPRCVLNAIIVNAAYGLFEFGHARKLWSYHTSLRKRKDFSVWVVAFVGTLARGAFEGILLAVAISLLLALRQIVNPKMDILGRKRLAGPTNDSPAGPIWVDIAKHPDAKQEPNLLVIRIDGPLFYANSERFQDHVSCLEVEAERRGEPLHAVVLSAASIPFLDATAVEVLQEMITSFKERGVRFYIATAYGGTREFLTEALGDKLAQGGNLQMPIDAAVELEMQLRAGHAESPAPRKRRSTSIIPLPSWELPPPASA